MKICDECSFKKKQTCQMSQPKRANPLLTDLLRYIKEKFGQLLTGLSRFL